MYQTKTERTNPVYQVRYLVTNEPVGVPTADLLYARRLARSFGRCVVEELRWDEERKCWKKAG